MQFMVLFCSKFVPSYFGQKRYKYCCSTTYLSRVSDWQVFENMKLQIYFGIHIFLENVILTLSFAILKFARYLKTWKKCFKLDMRRRFDVDATCLDVDNVVTTLKQRRVLTGNQQWFLELFLRFCRMQIVYMPK